MPLNKLDSILEILKKAKVITEEELKEGLRQSSVTGESLSVILTKLGYVTEEQIINVLSSHLKLKVVKISEDSLDPEVINIFPAKFVKRFKLIPFKLVDNTLTVVTSEPLNIHKFDDIGLLLGYEIEFALSTQKEIDEAIKRYYDGSLSETVDEISRDVKEVEISELEEEKIKDVESLANEAPIIRLVNLIITDAIKKRASDIHIEPFERDMVVRYRIDGILYDVSPPPKHLYPAIISRIKIMAELNIAEKRLPQDGRIQLRVEDREVDLRISTFPTMFGESVVIRILDKENVLLDLEELGFSKTVLDRYKGLINKPNGIILVTGPTGSGKTTTLYASLNRINTKEKKIITIEDPIEYQLNRINQLQVKPKIGLTFARGLRAMLRQDPDILLVGEIRDLETAEVAIQAALTGHLVFSTLHTNDAPSSITRLLDMGIESYLVSSSLIGVLAQRLVRIICPFCKEGYTPNKEIIKEIGAVSGIEFVRGKGCKECDGIGFRGRTGIFELLILNEEIRGLILEKTNASRIRQAAIQSGMETLKDDGLKKVKLGITTVEEVFRVTQESI